jgi:phosphate:Na+ symporter
MAAIGTSTTAKRLALAYVLFKLIAALIALVFFRPSIALINQASGSIDGVTLLAAYHTAYNVLGVMVVLPMINRFTRFVERLLPDKRSQLTRSLDGAALANPVVAVEAVRRTIALSIERIAETIGAAVSGAGEDIRALPMSEAIDALRQAQAFISEVRGRPASKDERLRLASTLRALDRASRLVEIAGEEPDFTRAKDGPDEAHAAALCAEAMHNAVSATSDIAREAALSKDADPIDTLETPSACSALAKLDDRASRLRDLRREHRIATVNAAGNGEITADQAMARIETVRRLEALTRQTARAVADLLGRDGVAV